MSTWMILRPGSTREKVAAGACPHPCAPRPLRSPGGLRPDAFALFNGPNEVAWNSCRGCRDSSFDYGLDGGLVEIYAARTISARVDSCIIHHNFATLGEGFLEVGGESGTSVTGVVVARNISWNNGGTFAFFHVSGNFGTAPRGLLLLECVGRTVEGTTERRSAPVLRLR